MNTRTPAHRKLIIRTSQVVRARFERWGVGGGCRLPDAAGVLQERKANPVFFASFDDPAQTLEILRSRWPALEEETIARAERIHGGRFDLLGYENLDFGDPIDWHLDPVRGVRAPLEHWSRIDFLNPETVGDHKVIWELNRHQYLVHLGKAYWYRGDERYAERFIGHISSWMKANPPKLGINWASSLEVAFRAIAWIWCLNLFRRSPSLTQDFRRRMLRYLHVHGRHIELYLSTCFSPNTHLTGEALGLVYLGLTLPELVGAKRWLQKGMRILESEVRKQIRPDGVHFEQATCYHRYTVDFLIHLRLLARRNAVPLDPGVVAKLEDSLVHLMHLTRPDGLTPLVGDDDGGRVLFLDSRSRAPNDFRSTLATGAGLYGRPDFARVAGDPTEETLWLLGPEGMRALGGLDPQPPAEESCAFRDSGFFVMRDGWETDGDYVLIRCGPHGALRGGHAHADALAFELTVRGTPILVDPGTYLYTADCASRDAFRSTEAHNTLTVNGESSCLPGGPFDWRQTCDGTPSEWISTERFDYFEGRHDGYSRPSQPVEHQRSILFLKGDYWIVRDLVEGEGALRVVSNLHFHPAVTLEDATANGGTVVDVKGPDQNRTLRVFLLGVKERSEEELGCFSSVYGQRLQAPVRRFAVAGQDRFELLTVLTPGSEQVSVTEQAGAREGVVHTLCIRGPTFADDLLIAGPGAVRWRDVEGDFTWLWIRRNPDGGITEYLALGVRELSVSGRNLFRSQKRAPYAYGLLTARGLR